MSNTAFVLGNGESRRVIEINELKERGKVFACNGVYRTHRPDWLIAVDPKMMLRSLSQIMLNIIMCIAISMYNTTNIKNY